MVDGRVLRLHLAGVSLSQVVPACIGRLTALQALNLDSNQLTNLLSARSSSQELVTSDVCPPPSLACLFSRPTARLYIA